MDPVKQFEAAFQKRQEQRERGEAPDPAELRRIEHENRKVDFWLGELAPAKPRAATHQGTDQG